MNDTRYITRPAEDGSVSISEEVIATIAAEALSNVDGVRPATHPKKNARTVKVKVADEKITLECSIVVEYGKSVQESAKKAQAEIADAVSSMTGIETASVHVIVSGIVPASKAAQ
jgi:uncharacterized alkaline shock family protein YloU